MSTAIVTADTITTAQIRALRTEAAAAGDDAMVNMCDLALSPRGTWHAVDDAGHPDDGGQQDQPALVAVSGQGHGDTLRMSSTILASRLAFCPTMVVSCL